MRDKKQRKKNRHEPKSKKQLRWYFPSTDHGEDHGFADSLLQYFQGDHEKYIARETIQNAVDARLDYERPVSVVFERFNIPSNSLPGQKELVECLHRCLEFVKTQPKAQEFFKSAIKLAKGEKISVLKISDFNTKGLSGLDNDVDGHWYRLVRATGTSTAKGVAGGSYGIGKGAPIAASGLRTVFYSSMDKEGQTVFQGKARLVSHQYKGKEDVRQGVGFYGVKGYEAIREPMLIPDLFKRQQQGTDIFIIGYTSGNDWKEKLIKSVLHNFWLAIFHGNLEVIVKDGSEKKLTKDNLAACLEEYDAEDAKYFFEAVTNPTQEFKAELKELGNVSLFVRKDESYPGKIMMVRKPKMLVTDKPYRILREPYAGVFICDNDKGNSLLRELEPVTHDKWDKDLALNGRAILLELDTFVREKLKGMAEAITSEPEDIPGLDRYLPDSEDADNLPDGKAEAFKTTDFSEIEESGREIGLEKDATSAEAEVVVRKGVMMKKEIGKINSTPPAGIGSGPKGRPTGGDDGDKEGIRIKTSSINFRSFVQRSKTGFEYHFIITGRENCAGAIRMVAVGDDGNYPVEIASAGNPKTGDSYEIKDSMIRGLTIGNGESLRLAVQLVSKKKYTLGIENYEG
jgi:hypothetical protein